MNTEKQPAVGGQVDGAVRPAVAVAHGSDEHLTLLGAPWHWNLLHGVDRADMLAFGRACMEAERERQTAPPPCALTWAIQRLNSTPYAMTKDECVQMLRGLRSEIQALSGPNA
jgi:hypothetical protein